MLNLYLNYGLYLPAEMLESIGKTLQMCGFPILQHNWYPLNNLIDWKLACNPWNEAIQEAVQLNIDQRPYFQRILCRIDSNHSENPYLFIQGPAGTGKTFLYNILYHHYRAKKNCALCCFFRYCIINFTR